MKSDFLSREILEKCWERAPRYDLENRFFSEDFDDLTEAGYLTLAVPEEMGGSGLTLAEVCREQRTLAYYAAPTALAVNMHLYWTGLAADLWRSGDSSLEWLLKKAAAGDVFAAGHAETGNDVPVLYSSTEARKVEGGYRFTGKKSFGSLTPVWTYLGMHATDSSDPEAPRIVHAFMPRGSEGSQIRQVWDTMGMRATASEDTVLEDVFVPDELVARVVPPGAAGVDLFVLGIFAWALLGFGNVYYGLARRIFDICVDSIKDKTSLALSRTMAHHAGIQHLIAEMAIELESIEPHLDRVAADWSEGVDHGANWPLKIVSAKYRAVEGSWRVVDQALDVIGGFGIFKKGGFERLFRDARLGRLHPANSLLTREFVAKTVLGIDFDARPRWG